MTHYGIYEYMRREAEKVGYKENGVQLEPVTLPPPNFGWQFSSGKGPPPGLVRLKAPGGVSAVSGGFTGNRYMVRGGVIEVAEEDAPGLINQGFKRV